MAHANLRVGVLSCVGMAVASTGMVFGGSPAACVIFLALGAMFSFTLIGVGAMSLQETAPAPMRGQVAALFAGVLNIIGAGLGPVAVGVITDYVLRDPSAIGTAIVVTCVTRKRHRPAALPQRLRDLRRHPRRRDGLARGHADAGDPDAAQPTVPVAAAH